MTQARALRVLPLLALLGSALAAEAQTWVPAPSGGRNAEPFTLAFPGARRILALGLPGILLRSADAGATWTEAPAPAGRFVQSVHPDTAWLLADTAVYRSSDGGLTWTRRPTPGDPFFQARFLTGSLGFLSNYRGGFYATVDGGATWTTRRNTAGKSLIPFDFVDAAHGFAQQIDSTGTWPWNYSLHKTSDSGKTWVPVALPADVPVVNGLRSIDFTTPLAGTITLRASGKLLELSTGDGGATWSRRELPGGDSISVLGSLGPSFLYGYRNTGSGQPVFSRDGGSTWNLFTGAFPGRVENQHWRHPDTGWATGQGFLSKTEDGGATWILQYCTFSNERRPRAMRFLDDREGWAAVDQTLYKTVDGGRSWWPQAVPSATWRSLYVADFLGARSLIATGIRYRKAAAVGHYDTAMVMRSGDGGLRWTVTAFDSGVALGPVSFGTARVGYLGATRAGAGGQALFKTEDAGETWKPLPSLVGASPGHLQFLDDMRGFVAASTPSGDTMRVLKTVDGGASFSHVMLFWRTGFGGMHWEDAQRGWVVARDTLRRTSDGGASWSKQALGATAGYLGVEAVDGQNAFLYGITGEILKTSDGFATLSREKLGIEIIDLQHLPSGKMFALGLQGDLLKRAGGPVALRRGPVAAESGKGKGKARLIFYRGTLRLEAARPGRAAPDVVDAAGRFLSPR